MADLLLGQVLSYDADPFAEGIAAARHESAGAVLVEGGRIAESGTFEELLANRGPFYELASRQLLESGAAVGAGNVY